jgi:hypothetical protein
MLGLGQPSSANSVARKDSSPAEKNSSSCGGMTDVPLSIACACPRWWIRLEPAEMDKLEELASASGLAVGAYLRACGLKSAGVRAKPRPSVDRELLARTNGDLNRVSNN